MPRYSIRSINHLILSALGLLLLGIYLVELPSGKLTVSFFDVGQGDAIFIQTPSGQQILIDGGPDRSVLQRLSGAMPFYDRTIDLVVVTHPDSDHLAGLLAVLERYRVSAIVESGQACASKLCQEWERRKQSEGARLYQEQLGREVALNDGVRLLMLHPFASLAGETLSKRNNGSLVVKLLYGQQSLLLTGDIEAAIENKLVLGRVNLDADFLKISHHGSQSSSTIDFLNQTTPQVAFISVGVKNTYGHPHPTVIERLEKLAIPYYRTDTHGTIKLILNGASHIITTSK